MLPLGTANPTGKAQWKIPDVGFPWGRDGLPLCLPLGLRVQPEFPCSEGALGAAVGQLPVKSDQHPPTLNKHQLQGLPSQ